MDAALATINAFLWHDYVLYIMVITGLVFTLWSGFSQYRALTHGVKVIRGSYDDPNDPGAINHFQALSAALSATDACRRNNVTSFSVSSSSTSSGASPQGVLVHGFSFTCCTIHGA